MNRTMIDFGIDLGTTNSAIAVAGGSDAAVVRNNHHRECTPSAVYVSRTGKVYVGDMAKDRVAADPENACSEFKLQMGVQGSGKTFEAAQRTMSPEELSGEVLKSLRGDAQKAFAEAIGSAVITVPAAFELDQNDATRRAAELAGLGFAPLIQEPTAAAWAYSAGEAPQRAFWLVYDLGGGTFDAAVIKVDDGEFVVVNHAGDNFLGGKLIDWALVDEVLIPAVRESGLTGLTRDDPRSAGNVAKLKAAAESAKIQLSNTDSVDVVVELKDDQGADLEFACELTRAQVERVARPLYVRSIALCRRALDEKGLGPGDVERVLLVGGATLAPSLRELLADPVEGLGIRLDHSQDPVTVVARGAAIFAGTQRLPAAKDRPVPPGQVALDFEYEPVGPDTEPLVGGQARAERPQEWAGSTIEFVDAAARPAWRSGQIALTAEGAFTTRLRAAEQTTTTFAVEFRDPQGTLVDTDPAEIGYRHGTVGRPPVLSHSVGVGLSDNDVAWLLQKGTELPASRRVVLRTAVDVRRHSDAGLIRVPLVEGERERADLDTLIGGLDIRPDEVRRDVPAGSEIEVSLRIDRSFSPRADAYVPVLDEEFEIEVDLGRTRTTDVALLRHEYDQLDQRHRNLRQEAAELEAPSALQQLDRLAEDGVLAEIRRLVSAAEVDPDAAPTCASRMRDAEAVLDDVDDDLELPRTISEARSLLETVRDLVAKAGNDADHLDFRAAEAALTAAVKVGSQTMIRRQIEALQRILRRMLENAGVLDAVVFGQFEREFAQHADRDVQRLLKDGKRYLAGEDAHGLRTVLAELRRRLPEGPAGRTGHGSTVTGGTRW
ncbi:Hsp70 family protein [Saccharopolyspora sp. NPDC002578]